MGEEVDPGLQALGHQPHRQAARPFARHPSTYSGGVDWAARIRPLLQPGPRRARARAMTSARIWWPPTCMITDHSSAGFEYLLRDRPLVRIHRPRPARDRQRASRLRGSAGFGRRVGRRRAAPSWRRPRGLADPGARSARRRDVAPRTCSIGRARRPRVRSPSCTMRSSSLPRGGDRASRGRDASRQCDHAGVQRRALHRRRDRLGARPDVRRFRARGRRRRVDRRHRARSCAARQRLDRADPAASGRRTAGSRRPATRRCGTRPAICWRCSTATTSGRRGFSRRSSRSSPLVPTSTSSRATPGPRRLRGRSAGASDPGSAAARRTSSTILGDEFSVFIMSVFRRRVYDTIGGFDETLRTNEDYDFWLRAALAGFTVRAQRRAARLLPAPRRQPLGQRGADAARHPAGLLQAASGAAPPAGRAAAARPAGAAVRRGPARGRGARGARSAGLPVRHAAPVGASRAARRHHAGAGEGHGATGRRGCSGSAYQLRRSRQSAHLEVSS